MNLEPLLVADVGGTHARFALARFDGEASAWHLTQPQVLGTADYTSLESALAAYLDGVAMPLPRHACLAVAGPVQDGQVRLTNLAWSCSGPDLRRHFGFSQLDIINDFAALALSLGVLAATDVGVLKLGEVDLRAPRVVLGPGTGFGAAALLPAGRSGYPLCGEAGHASLAVTATPEAREVISVLSRQVDHVSVESVLCGQGLVRLYRGLAEVRGLPASLDEPSQVTASALQGDTLGVAAVCLFSEFLAATAGDLALIYGARGGVYLGGGIAGRIRPWLETPEFVQHFVAKGAMRDYLQAIPINLITHPYPALLGAAAWLHRQAGQE